MSAAWLSGICLAHSAAMLAAIFLFLQATLAQEQVDYIMRLSEKPHPIFKRASIEIVQIAPNLKAELLVFDQPLRTLLRSLQMEHGEISCDCGMFVQIQSMLRYTNDRPAVLLSTDANPAQLIACACKQNFAYLRPRDDFAFQLLQNSSYLNKGQWLYPAADGQYWGLTSEGPLKLSEGEWKAHLDRHLLEEFFEEYKCEASLDPRSNAYAEFQFIKMLYKTKALEEWTLVPILQSEISLVYQRKLHRIIREAADRASLR